MKRMMAGNFTIVELLVVMAVIAIMASMLLPTLQSARAKVKVTSCSNQMRQLGISMQQYAGSFEDYLPTPYIGTGSNKWWFFRREYSEFIGMQYNQARQQMFMCQFWNGKKYNTTSFPWLPGTYWSYSLYYPGYSDAACQKSPKITRYRQPGSAMVLYDGRPMYGGAAEYTYCVVFSSTDFTNILTSPADYCHPHRKTGMLFVDGHSENNGRGDITFANLNPF